MSKTARMRAAWIRVAVAVFFCLAAVLVAVFTLRVFVPKPRTEPVQPSDAYTPAAMQAAVAPEKVRNELDNLLGFGSRFMGQPGFYQVEDYIRTRFEEAGLEVLEQGNRTAMPRTLYREIYAQSGDSAAGARGDYVRLDDIEIFPFWPNHMQPMVTPEDGLSGELLLVSEEVLKTHGKFDGCIALLDGRTGKVPANILYDAATYAAMGFEAVIVAHPEGLGSIPWSDVVGNGWIPSGPFMNESVPMNYVRVAATEGIFNYVGRRIKLRVKTVWDNIESTTIIGVLRAKQPTDKMIMVTADYSACSLLPDYALGVLQAYEPAIQLCLLEGLLPYKDTITRDVFFVATTGRAMSEDGAKNLLRVLGKSQAGVEQNRLLAALQFTKEDQEAQKAERLASRSATRLDPWRTRNLENETRLEMLDKIMPQFDHPAFLTDSKRTLDFLRTTDKATRKFFEEQCKYVLDTLLLERSEETLKAKLAFERQLPLDLQSPAFNAYLAVKREYDEARYAAGYRLDYLLDIKQPYLQKYRARDRWRDRFVELVEHHTEKKKLLAQDMGIVELFNPYDEIFTVVPDIIPAFNEQDNPETLSFAAGSYLVGPPERVFEILLISARQNLKLEKEVSLPQVGRWHDNSVWKEMGQTPYGMSLAWRKFGYPCYRLLNFGRVRSYDRYVEPQDTPFMHNTETMRNSLAMTGELALVLAHGLGKFPPMSGDKYDFKGRVLVSNVGQTIVPDYPLKNALLGSRSRLNPFQFHAGGFYTIPFEFADVYGEFDFFNMDNCDHGWVNERRNLDDGLGFSPIACGFGPDGLIAYMKDEGEDGQRLYKSTGIT
ncbi:MAG: hypothetical protein NTZ09_16530, partial [Candidatus Hydrogenedentes bacterium]|nr:hypothetical protein [Candidatus Hydrogenedentota bacterium]